MMISPATTSSASPAWRLLMAGPSSTSASSTPASTSAAELLLPAARRGSGNSLDQISSSLDTRVQNLQDRTLGFAQDMMSQFASQLFGSDTAGMSVSFDSMQLSAESSVAAAVQTSRGPGGSSAAAGVRLDDAASFSGKGTITTADGRQFSFEMEVNYSASVEAASAMNTTSAPPGLAQDSQAAVPTDSSADWLSAPPKKPKNGVRDDMQLGFAGSAADLLRMFAQGDLSMPFSLASADKATSNPTTGDSKANSGSDAAQASEARQGVFNMRLLDLLPPAQDARSRLEHAYSSAASSSQESVLPQQIA